MKQAEAAFGWIVGILRRRGVPFQVAGGLAARAYGSRRELHDIDLYVPGSRFADFTADVSPYVAFGPQRVVDHHWDIVFMKLVYRGQTIEIGDGECVRIFSREEGAWLNEIMDFSDFETRQVLGLWAPVMRRSRLLAYKRRLGRAVDRDDIAQILAAPDVSSAE